MIMTKEEIFQERERNASKVWDTVYSEVFPTMPPSYPNAWTRSSMLRFSDQENAELRRELSEMKAREKDAWEDVWNQAQHHYQFGPCKSFDDWYATLKPINSRLNK